MSVQSANVARFLPEMAQRVPAVCAVKAAIGRNADGTIRYRSQTFLELEASSNAMGLELSERGISRGDRVLLMVKPGLPLIEICFALFKMGAVPVVIDPGMGLKRFLGCVERSKPDAIVGIGFATFLARVFRKTFRTVGCRVTVNQRLARSMQKRVGAFFESAVCAVDELAAILFTSGSTGAPKGVCYEHGMFDAQVRLIRETYGIEPGEVDLPMLPIFALFNPALGMTTVVPEMNPSKPATVDPAKIVAAIRENGVTNSFGSPVLWTKISRYCEAEQIELPTLKRVLMAGAPVSPDLMERLGRHMPNGMIHTPYGATECLPVSTISAFTVLSQTAERTRAGKGTCVGHPLSEVSVRIIAISDSVLVGESALTALPEGEIGEIVVTGPSVTKAYDQLAAATAAAKIVDEGGCVWHRMGDLGYLDADGRLWFCGRKVERVVTPEGPLYTDPVEALFNAHPAIFRSALIGLGTAPTQIPALVVQKEKGARLTEADLGEWAQAHAMTARIERFFFHQNFPVDVRHNAKIHRLTLKELFEQGS